MNMQLKCLAPALRSRPRSPNYDHVMKSINKFPKVGENEANVTSSPAFAAAEASSALEPGRYFLFTITSVTGRRTRRTQAPKKEFDPPRGYKIF